MELKREFSDFKVEEKPDVECSGSEESDYLYFWMFKEDMTTDYAVGLLSDFLGIPRKDVGYAGNKDRRAVTKQLISVRGVDLEDLESFEMDGLSLEFFGFGDGPISLGDLEGNHFEILVRDISDKERNNFFSRVEEVESISFINYFDEQRFSSDNIRIGRSMVKGRFEEGVEIICDHDGGYHEEVKDYLENNKNDFIGSLRKVPKNVLRLFVHSYQSWLWNEYVGEKIKDICDDYYSVSYSEGKLIFCEESIDDEMVPLVGFNTELEDNLYKDILDEEDLDSRDFILHELPELSAEGDCRNLLVEASDLSFSVNDDGSVLVSFYLPKGSYATMFLKKLFN